MVENIFDIICILMAAKKYTSNFSDTSFVPDYRTSSKISLTAPSNQPDFQCIFKIFQNLAHFLTFFKTAVIKEEISLD